MEQFPKACYNIWLYLLDFLLGLREFFQILPFVDETFLAERILLLIQPTF